MALSEKRGDVKYVPWFSPAEWFQVYEQVYSDNAAEQIKAYKTLLSWKVRVPKLPIGVDCTLSILQVCLRDREWTPKIINGELPVHYENDLCLMYSTTIMRLLNHISNIGHTKQTSLFQIAKQLKIPDWIVNLRHDAAHGHELPSIDVLRIAVNILLAWLYEEYWAAEANVIEERYANDVTLHEIDESEEVQPFVDLVELWASVSLYSLAGYNLVSDIPDPELLDALQDLREYAMSSMQQNDGDVESDNEEYTDATKLDIKGKSYKLSTAQIVLLSEISRYLGKKRTAYKEALLLNALFNVDTFLPSPDVLPIFIQSEETENALDKNFLPLGMILFWKDILLLLHEKNMLQQLIIKLLHLVNSETESKHKRHLASLWISSICYTFLKLDFAQCIAQTLENKFTAVNRKLPVKVLSLKVKEEVNRNYPQLENIPSLNLSDIIPQYLTSMNFISDLILHANQFSLKFISPLLALVTPIIDNRKQMCLFDLIEVYTANKKDNDGNSKNNCIHDKLFSVNDLENLHNKEMPQDNNAPKNKSVEKSSLVIADNAIRNLHWTLAVANYNWKQCPIGILPWQNETLNYLEPLEVVSLERNPLTNSGIVPGVIDKSLKAQARVNWDTVLRKKKRLKRKFEKADMTIINKAIATAKKQK